MRIFVTSRSFFFLSFFFSYFFWLKNRRKEKKKRATREKRHRNQTGEKRGSIGNCVIQEGQLMGSAQAWEIIYVHPPEESCPGKQNCVTFSIS